MLNTVLEEMNSNTNAKIALKSNKRSHRLLFSGSRTKQDYGDLSCGIFKWHRYKYKEFHFVSKQIGK